MTALVALCLGYFWGRQIGRGEGMILGKAYAPLELRIKALQSGSCPICQTDFESPELEQEPGV